MASAGEDGKLFIFELLTGRNIRTQCFNQGTEINDVCFLHDHESVVCSTSTKELVLIKPGIKHGKVVHVLKRVGRTLACSPCGNNIDYFIYLNGGCRNQRKQ